MKRWDVGGYDWETHESADGEFVLYDDLMNDPGNTIFGLPLSKIQSLIYEYQSKGVDPYEVVQLKNRVKELEQYEWMYKDLCK